MFIFAGKKGNHKSLDEFEFWLDSTTECRRELGGLVVERRTPEREVGVRYLPPPCCVLEQRHIYFPKSTGNNTQEAVALSCKLKNCLLGR